MPRKALTDRALKALKPAPRGKRYDVMDSVVPSLGIRVTDSVDHEGKARQRTFILVARFPGSKNPTRRALGTYGELTLEAARTKARSWLELLGAGIDPSAHEAQKRREVVRRQAITFAFVAEEFMAKHVSKLRSATDVERAIRREILPELGDRPIAEISKREIILLLKAVVDRGAPYTAHHLLAYLRKIWNWAISQDVYDLEISPCDRIVGKDLIGTKTSRKRVLSHLEIAAVWSATGGPADYPLGPFARLLLVLGCRRDELAAMTRDEVDLKAGTWTLTDDRTKNEQPRILPLPGLAIEILRSLPSFSGPFIFSTTSGQKPISGFSKLKRRLDGRLSMQNPQGIAPWMFHDLRRTMRTNLSALPISPLVRELMIGHAQKGVAAVYDQHLYQLEQRHGFELWTERLAGIVGPLNEACVPVHANA